MKLFTRRTFSVLIIGVIIMLLFMSLLSGKGGKPADPAQLLREPCPGTPNCISTMYPEDLKHFMPSLPFKESLDQSREVIIHILENYSGAEIIEQENTFIYAQFTIPIFQFIDDVVFYFDQEVQAIHFRSSSRIGKGDLGVNRRRMKKISQRYLDYN